jgi:hypothetical protein
MFLVPIAYLGYNHWEKQKKKERLLLDIENGASHLQEPPVSETFVAQNEVGEFSSGSTRTNKEGEEDDTVNAQISLVVSVESDEDEEKNLSLQQPSETLSNKITDISSRRDTAFSQVSGSSSHASSISSVGGSDDNDTLETQTLHSQDTIEIEEMSSSGGTPTVTPTSTPTSQNAPFAAFRNFFADRDVKRGHVYQRGANDTFIVNGQQVAMPKISFK